MKVYLVWPIPSALFHAATLCNKKNEVPDIVMETGQRTLHDSLMQISQYQDAEIMIFSPFVTNKPIEALLQTIIQNHCRIDWYGELKDNEVDNNTGLQDLPGLTIHQSLSPVLTKEINHYLLYKITLAFFGDKEGNIERSQLKDAIEKIAADLTQVPSKEAYFSEAFSKFNFPAIEGDSPTIQALKNDIRRVAGSGFENILLLGESGSGKEASAFFLHHLDPNRQDYEFQAINCAGLQEDFLVSELFGHVRGAYTGANKAREGLIAQLNGGTLFLDELPDMPARVQAMLLRFLESGEYTPMGSNKTVTADVKVIAAGQPELLAEKIMTRQFRKDLYYRLAGKIITVPALRDISSDIPIIISHLVYKMDQNDHLNRNNVIAYFNNHIDAYKKYHWPGNVRELANYVKRIIKLGTDEKIELGEYEIEQLLMQIKSTQPEEEQEKSDYAITVTFSQLNPRLTSTQLSNEVAVFERPDTIKKKYIKYVYKCLTEKGFSNDKIRKKLNISINTLRSHIQ